MLMFLLIFRIFITINRNSFYYIWIFLEINTIIFLTYLIVNMNFVRIISIKYYLIRSFRSIIFIFFVNMNIFIYKLNYVIIILNLIIIIKLGIIPFHFWFIDIIIFLNWYICFILSTIQKFIPFVILSYLYMKKLCLLISLLGGIYGLIIMFNNIILKSIFGYSSINHIFWIFITLLIKFNLWLIYFVNYVFINGVLFYLFNYFNFDDLKIIYFKIKENKYFFVIILFSLGGLPPFYGFLLKWYIIINIFNWFIYFIIIILIIYSLIFLYFYIRIIFRIILMNYFNLFLINFNLKFICLNFYIINLFFLIITLNLIIFFFWIIY